MVTVGSYRDHQVFNLSRNCSNVISAPPFRIRQKTGSKMRDTPRRERVIPFLGVSGGKNYDTQLSLRSLMTLFHPLTCSQLLYNLSPQCQHLRRKFLIRKDTRKILPNYSLSC